MVPVPLKVVPVPEDIFGPEEKWYRYHSKWYRYLIDSEELVPVPVKVVPVPLFPATLNWHIFAQLSPVFVHDCLGTLRND